MEGDELRLEKTYLRIIESIEREENNQKSSNQNPSIEKKP
jgi:hypothetical protein